MSTEKGFVHVLILFLVVVGVVAIGYFVINENRGQLDPQVDKERMFSALTPSLIDKNNITPAYNPTPTEIVQQDNFGVQRITLDDIDLIIDSPFMPGSLMSPPSDEPQLAGSVDYNPFREFSIQNMKYGFTNSFEDLPGAQPGGEDIYRSKLNELRQNQGGIPSVAPTVILFGQPIIGSYSIVDLSGVDEDEYDQTLIAEWVVDAESHLWILRIARSLSDGTDPVDFLNSLEGINIEVDNTRENQ